MTSKTSTERVQALRQQREALGIVRLEIYAEKKHHEEIKEFAKKLQKESIPIPV